MLVKQATACAALFALCSGVAVEGDQPFGPNALRGDVKPRGFELYEDANN